MRNLIQKYNSLSAPSKATIWFIICNFILKGISFITGPIFTRLLSEEEYGILSVFSSYEQIVLILATWEMQIGAFQKGIFKYKNNIELFTTATQAFVNIITIIFFVIVLLCFPIVYSFTGMNLTVILFLFLYMIFQPSYTYWLTRKRTLYDYKSAVVITLLYGIVCVAFPMILVLSVNKTANTKFIGTLLGASLVGMIFYFRYANYKSLVSNKNLVKEYWKFLISFEGPVVLHSLSFLVLSQADRIMIGKMVGNSEAAFYSVAYSLAVIVSILQNSINQSLLPWRYQMLEQKNYKRIKTVTHRLLIGFAAIILLYILVAPDIVDLLFPSSYYEAVWCMPPVAAGIYFMFLYTIFVNIESYYEKTKYIVYVSVTCGLINIGLNYFCINLFGYIACGYTTLVSYILFAIGHYIFMKKVLNDVGVSDNIVNPRFVIIISSIVVIASIGISLLYMVRVLRYITIAISIILILIKRKNVRELFNRE